MEVKRGTALQVTGSRANVEDGMHHTIKIQFCCTRFSCQNGQTGQRLGNHAKHYPAWLYHLEGRVLNRLNCSATTCNALFQHCQAASSILMGNSFQRKNYLQKRAASEKELNQ